MKKIWNAFNSLIGLVFNFLIWSVFGFIACTIGQSHFSWNLAFGIWLTALLFNKFLPNFQKIGRNKDCEE